VTGLTIHGWNVLCGAGTGYRALLDALDGARPASPVAAGRAVSTLCEDPPPRPDGHALAEFDVRAELGRKGTSTLDRGTALALVSVRDTLADGAVLVNDETRARTGVAFGTTMGSLKSTSDYSAETLRQDRPYLVNPMLFPNTVMNRAAAQVAIWFGLKGVNATVAGGPLAFLHTLRYAGQALRNQYADVMIAGVVEEFTAHSAWLHERARGSAAPPPGEGAASFALRRSGPGDAEVLSVTTGFSPDGGPARMERCLRRALADADVQPDDIALIITGDTGSDDVETTAVRAVLGRHDDRMLHVQRAFGDCQAATGGLQLAAALALHRDDPSRDGQLTVLTAHTPAGGVGAAVVRGWSRAGTDRG